MHKFTYVPYWLRSACNMFETYAGMITRDRFDYGDIAYPSITMSFLKTSVTCVL